MPQPLPVLVLLSLDLQTSVRRWLCVAGDDDGDCDDEDEGGCSGCDDGGDIEVDGNGHSDSAGDDNTAT